MRFEIALCTALAVVALGLGPVQAQDGAGRGTSASRDADEDDDLILAERREELIREADAALEQLRERSASAASLLEQAYGHAVFETTKGGLIVTGLGGTGVARKSDGSDVTFMRLGAAGIGLGAGLENYKLILLFADEDNYSRFVSGQWDGALSAQAAAGSEGVAAEEQFIGGIRAFRLTDGGLMAQIDATALRVWPIDRLNRAAEIEERIAAASGGEVPEAIEESLASAEPEPAEDVPSEAEPETEPEPSNPEWLDEIAAERDDLSIFVAAVKAAGLADALTGSTAYTVFAPTDEAFESMSGLTREELLAPENRAELVRLLRAHIVADDLDREMARNIREALTIDGGTVNVDVEGDEFTVGDASVVASDLERGNLRVHVVDGLLTPTRVAAAEAGAEAEPERGSAAEPERESAPERERDATAEPETEREAEPADSAASGPESTPSNAEPETPDSDAAPSDAPPRDEEPAPPRAGSPPSP
ncbi:MAG TPA: fasciclin domain-containing protein [Gammaproteobacteria bacterium]